MDWKPKSKLIVFFSLFAILMVISFTSFLIELNQKPKEETVIEKPIKKSVAFKPIEIKKVEVEQVSEEVEFVSDSSFTEIPVNIEIDAAKINQKLIETGLNEKGEMYVGETAHEIYTFKPPFDDFKNLLVSGHKDWKGSLGKLFYSDKWVVGTELVLTYENGEKETFVLSEKAHHKVSETPANLMDLFDGQKRVTVITCNGNFVQGYGYEERFYNIFVEKS